MFRSRRLFALIISFCTALACSDDGATPDDADSGEADARRGSGGSDVGLGSGARPAGGAGTGGGDSRDASASGGHAGSGGGDSGEPRDVSTESDGGGYREDALADGARDDGGDSSFATADASDAGVSDASADGDASMVDARDAGELEPIDCSEVQDDPGPRDDDQDGLEDSVDPCLGKDNASGDANANGYCDANELGNTWITTPAQMAILADVVYVEYLYVGVSDPSFADLRGAESILNIGSLAVVDSPALATLSGLDSLAEVGILTIRGNGSLTDLRGLESLKTIRSALFVSGNDALKNLDGLGPVRRVGAAVEIQSNPALESLSGLDGLCSIGNRAIIINNESMRDLRGLRSLSLIEGDLVIRDMGGLTSLHGVTRLASVRGNLEIDNAANLVSLAGMAGLSQIHGTLWIHDNPSLQSLEGLEGLTRVARDFQLERNAGLRSLSGLDNLSRVLGSVTIAENERLSDLSGLANVLEIGMSLEVNDNATLSSLNPLQEWPWTAVKTNFSIRDNPSLAQCEVDELDDHLQGACSGCTGNDGPGLCSAHCANGIQDANETGVDCGGACQRNGADRCRSDCRCGVGEGHCASSDECVGGLVCGTGLGSVFGFEGDACVPPHCMNGALDSGELKIDCGGECGACECEPDNGLCDPLTTCSPAPDGVLCGLCPIGYTGDGKTGCVQSPDSCIAAGTYAIPLTERYCADDLPCDSWYQTGHVCSGPPTPWFNIQARIDPTPAGLWQASITTLEPILGPIRGTVALRLTASGGFTGSLDWNCEVPGSFYSAEGEATLQLDCETGVVSFWGLCAADRPVDMCYRPEEGFSVTGEVPAL